MAKKTDVIEVEAALVDVQARNCWTVLATT